MNDAADAILNRANQLLAKPRKHHTQEAPLSVGVDLGTAYTVFVVLNKNGIPVAARSQFSNIVRDGLVVDFIGAVNLVTAMKQSVEEELGVSLTSAATAYPPGVSPADVRATQNVLIAAGFDHAGLVDEPSAANALLKIQDGAVVDVGGGTTGIAIIQNGQVVYTADEPTGGTQLTLVIAGALNLSFEEAEIFKNDPTKREVVESLVRPTLQKIGSIVARHVAAHDVGSVHMVGGTSAAPGTAGIVGDIIQRPVFIAKHPMLVTPVGIALFNQSASFGDSAAIYPAQ